MGRKLYIYVGADISRENVYFCHEPAKLIEALSLHLIDEVDLDNYRIESGYAKVKPSSPRFAQNNASANYAIEYDDEDGYFRCYFITSTSMHGDYFIYALQVDYWHTYVHRTDFEHVRATRCNRNIGNGIYDEISHTKGLPLFQPIQIDSMPAQPNVDVFDDHYVDIVILLEYNTYQSALFGTVTTNRLVSASLGEIKEWFVSKNPSFSKVSSVDLAIDFAGGIKSITSLSSYFGFNYDARALKAWIVPRGFIYRRNPIIDGEKYIAVTSIGRFDTIENATLAVLQPQAFITELPVKNLSDLSLNRKYTCGTLNRGLTLQRHTDSGSEGVLLMCNTSADEIKMLVWQGENQQDITDAFSVFLSTNGAVDIGIRSLVNGASAIGKSITSTLKGAEKGGVLGGVSSATASASNFVAQRAFNDVMGGGDGYRSWFRDQSATANEHLVSNPFGVTSLPSIIDEEKHIYETGAMFDVYLGDSDFLEITSEVAPLMYSPDFTYIAADAIVTGVPKDACDDIKERLANGIHYKYISS